MQLADIERALLSEDARAGEWIVELLEQEDPYEADAFEEEDDDFNDDDEDDEDEEDDEDDDAGFGGSAEVSQPTEEDNPFALDDAPKPPKSPDDWTLARLKKAVHPKTLAGKTATEKKLARKEAFEGLAAAKDAPARFQIGRILEDLLNRNDEYARQVLSHVFRFGPIKLGPWQVMKRAYKAAEKSHDLKYFAILAHRFDQAKDRVGPYSEVSKGTLVYLSHRAWRWLRHLGQALPELYPVFAGQLMAEYTPGFDVMRSGIIPHILRHPTSAAVRHAKDELSLRAFDEAWKISADPLLRLLEDAQNDHIARFAIDSLKRDFPNTLHDPEPAWLARLAERSLESVHDLIADMMAKSPELHASKLTERGLFDTMIKLLRSPSAEARRIAIEFAQTYAPNLPLRTIIRLADEGEDDVQKFAIARIKAMPASALGLDDLLEMVSVDELSELASQRIRSSATPKDLTRERFLTLALGEWNQRNFLDAFYKHHKTKAPISHWLAVLEDPRGKTDWSLLHKVRSLVPNDYSASELDSGFVARAILDAQLSRIVTGWYQNALNRGELKADAVDAELWKSLIFRPRLRELALSIVGNADLVAPKAIGLGWILALARSPDEALNEFAKKYLLEHFAPADFGEKSKPESGIEKLFSLVKGANEPEPVRIFAATYLLCHHPVLGPSQSETRSFGLTPKLPREAFTRERLDALVDDGRADVRRLGVALYKAEMVRVADARRLYALADATTKEVRGLAADLLLAVGEPDADPSRTPPVEWLDSDAIFALAESREKSSRELALSLIRRHYARVGTTERLGWLMESADREVRLFAARLLFEKHRPQAGQESFDRRRTKKRGPVAQVTKTVPYKGDASLRTFLRTSLFGLPPGRLERRDSDAATDRPIPASVAKRRLVEVVRDLSLEQPDFARDAVWVLEEFTRSGAKGEWQSCHAALAHIRARHPDLFPERAAMLLPQRPPRAKLTDPRGK